MSSIGLFSALLLRTPNPMVVVSNQGINYKPAPFGLVLWSEIVHVGIRRQGLVVAVRDNKSYFEKLPLLQRCRWWSSLAMLPGDLLLIPAQAIDVELTELFQRIDESLSRHEASKQPEA